MLIKISSKLNSGSNTIAPESIYLNRRAILRNLGFLGIASNFLKMIGIKIKEPKDRLKIYGIPSLELKNNYKIKNLD